MTTGNWTGSSGTRYEMNIRRLGTSIPHYAGVYVLCKRRQNVWSSYYIGQAEDIGDRLSESNHLGRDCAMRQGASFVATTQVEGGKEARLTVERDLLAAYAPPCNG